MIERQFLNDSVLQLSQGFQVYVYNDKFVDVICDKFKEKYNIDVEIKEKKDYFIIKPLEVAKNKKRKIKEV